jgi:hypothetical protein
MAALVPHDFASIVVAGATPRARDVNYRLLVAGGLDKETLEVVRQAFDRSERGARSVSGKEQISIDKPHWAVAESHAAVGHMVRQVSSRRAEQRANFEWLLVAWRGPQLDAGEEAGVRAFLTARLPQLAAYVEQRQDWSGTSLAVQVPQFDQWTREAQRLFSEFTQVREDKVRLFRHLQREQVEQLDKLAKASAACRSPKADRSDLGLLRQRLDQLQSWQDTAKGQLHANDWWKLSNDAARPLNDASGIYHDTKRRLEQQEERVRRRREQFRNFVEAIWSLPTRLLEWRQRRPSPERTADDDRESRPSWPYSPSPDDRGRRRSDDATVRYRRGDTSRADAPRRLSVGSRVLLLLGLALLIASVAYIWPSVVTHIAPRWETLQQRNGPAQDYSSSDSPAERRRSSAKPPTPAPSPPPPERSPLPPRNVEVEWPPHHPSDSRPPPSEPQRGHEGDDGAEWKKAERWLGDRWEEVRDWAGSLWSTYTTKQPDPTVAAILKTCRRALNAADDGLDTAALERDFEGRLTGARDDIEAESRSGYFDPFRLPGGTQTVQRGLNRARIKTDAKLACALNRTLFEFAHRAIRLRTRLAEEVEVPIRENVAKLGLREWPSGLGDSEFLARRSKAASPYLDQQSDEIYRLLYDDADAGSLMSRLERLFPSTKDRNALPHPLIQDAISLRKDMRKFLDELRGSLRK